MKKILIPIDSSENSKRAVEEAKIMAEKFGSDVVLLYVVALRIANTRFNAVVSQEMPLDPGVELEKKGAAEMLKEYKEYFGDKQGKVETVILHGIVPNEIIEYIETSDVDFVIMGSHGIGSALYRNILGSVTSKVLHNVTKPVMVVR